MDVGDQDRAGPDLVQLVHDPVHVGAQHHGLDGDPPFAVQAMVLRGDVHRIMDELYEVGARAILVTDIHACRL